MYSAHTWCDVFPPLHSLYIIDIFLPRIRHWCAVSAPACPVRRRCGMCCMRLPALNLICQILQYYARGGTFLSAATSIGHPTFQPYWLLGCFCGWRSGYDAMKCRRDMHRRGLWIGDLQGGRMSMCQGAHDMASHGTSGYGWHDRRPQPPQAASALSRVRRNTWVPFRHIVPLYCGILWHNFFMIL